jgi:hypothetical protein
MKKLNIPEYYQRYYTATDHPEIIDVENANPFAGVCYPAARRAIG